MPLLFQVPHQAYNLRPHKTFLHLADQSMQSYRTIAGASVYSNSYVQPKVLEAVDDDVLPQTERSVAETQQHAHTSSAAAREEPTECPDASQIVQYFHEAGLEDIVIVPESSSQQSVKQEKYPFLQQ